MILMKFKVMVALTAAVSLLAVVKPVSAEPRPMPTTQAESLSGHEVVLPLATAGHPAVIVIGFSNGSSRMMQRWDKEIGAQVTAKPGVPLYNMAVLQDAPKFIRGVITHSIKALVPAAGHDRFLTVVQGEQQLKKAVDFSSGDDCYVVVLDAAGNIVYHTQGEPSESSKQQIIAEIQRP